MLNLFLLGHLLYLNHLESILALRRRKRQNWIKFMSCITQWLVRIRVQWRQTGLLWNNFELAMELIIIDTCGITILLLDEQLRLRALFLIARDILDQPNFAKMTDAKGTFISQTHELLQSQLPLLISDVLLQSSLLSLKADSGGWLDNFALIWTLELIASYVSRSWASFLRFGWGCALNFLAFSLLILA